MMRLVESTRIAEVTAYDVHDECFAVVTGRCSKGAFLELDNGEPAFCYRHANLLPGTLVLCAILKKADPEHGRNILCGISSVLWDIGPALAS